MDKRGLIGLTCYNPADDLTCVASRTLSLNMTHFFEQFNLSVTH
jgi:hypothetical protein